MNHDLYLKVLAEAERVLAKILAREQARFLRAQQYGGLFAVPTPQVGTKNNTPEGDQYVIQ